MKHDLKEFNIPIDFEYIASKSKESFKKIVKNKAKELALKRLLKSKAKHSKLANLEYDAIEMQSYFLREDVKIEQKRLIFKYRTRMAEYGENFQAGRHFVIHILTVNCPLIKTRAKISGSISDITVNTFHVKQLQKISE